jgi:hypothetical protein
VGKVTPLTSPRVSPRAHCCGRVGVHNFNYPLFLSFGRDDRIRVYVCVRAHIHTFPDVISTSNKWEYDSIREISIGGKAQILLLTFKKTDENFHESNNLNIITIRFTNSFINCLRNSLSLIVFTSNLSVYKSIGNNKTRLFHH